MSAPQAAAPSHRAPRNNLDPLQNADLEKGKIIEVLEATDENLFTAFEFAKQELADVNEQAFRSEHLRLAVAVAVASNMLQAQECDVRLAGTHHEALRMHSVTFMDGAMRLLRFSGRIVKMLKQLVHVADWSSRVAHVFDAGPDGLRELQHVAALLQQLRKRFQRLHKLLTQPFPITGSAVLAAATADWRSMDFEQLKAQALLLRDLRGNKHVTTFVKDTLETAADIHQRLEDLHSAVLDNITLLDRRRCMQRSLQGQVLGELVPQCRQIYSDCVEVLRLTTSPNGAAARSTPRVAPVSPKRMLTNHQARTTGGGGGGGGGEQDALVGTSEPPAGQGHTVPEHPALQPLRQLEEAVRSSALATFAQVTAADQLAIVEGLQDPASFGVEPGQTPDPFMTAVAAADRLSTACRQLRELATVPLLNTALREVLEELSSWNDDREHDELFWNMDQFVVVVAELKQQREAAAQRGAGAGAGAGAGTGAEAAPQGTSSSPSSPTSASTTEAGRGANREATVAADVLVEDDEPSADELAALYNQMFPLPRIAVQSAELKQVATEAVDACVKLCRRVARTAPEQYLADNYKVDRFFEKMSLKSRELQGRINNLWGAVENTLAEVEARLRQEREVKCRIYQRDFAFMSKTYQTLQTLMADQGMTALTELPEMAETFAKMEALAHGHFKLLEMNLDVRDPVRFQQGLEQLERSSQRAQQDIHSIKGFVHAQIAQVLERLVADQKVHEDLRNVTLKQLDIKISELHKFVESQHAQLAHSKPLSLALDRVAKMRAQCFAKLAEKLVVDTSNIEAISQGHGRILQALHEKLDALGSTIDAAMQLALHEAKELLRRGGVCTRVSHDLQRRHVDLASSFVADLQQHIHSRVPILLTPVPSTKIDIDDEAKDLVVQVTDTMGSMKELFQDMVLAVDECRHMLANNTTLQRPPLESLSGQLDRYSHTGAALSQPLAGDDELSAYTSALRLAIESAMAMLQKKKIIIRDCLRVYHTRQEEADALTHEGRQRQSEQLSKMQLLVQPLLKDTQSRISEVAARCNRQFRKVNDACLNYLKGLSQSSPENPYMFCSTALLQQGLAARRSKIDDYVRRMQECLAIFSPELQHVCDLRRSAASAIDKLLSKTSKQLATLKEWIRRYPSSPTSAQHFFASCVAASNGDKGGSAARQDAGDRDNTALPGLGLRLQGHEQTAWHCAEAAFHTAHLGAIETALKRVDRVELEITAQCAAELNSLDLGSSHAIENSMAALKTKVREWIQSAHKFCHSAAWEVEDVGIRQLRVFVLQRGLWYHACGHGEVALTRLELDAAHLLVQASAEDEVVDSMETSYSEQYNLLSASMSDVANYIQETAHCWDVSDWETLSQRVESVQAQASRLSGDLQLVSKPMSAVLKEVRNFLPRPSDRIRRSDSNQSDGDSFRDEDPVFAEMLARSSRSNWLDVLGAVAHCAVRPLAQLIYFACLESQRWTQWLDSESKASAQRQSKRPAYHAQISKALEGLRRRVTKSAATLSDVLQKVVSASTLAEEEEPAPNGVVARQRLEGHWKQLRSLRNKIRALEIHALDALASLIGVQAFCRESAQDASNYPWQLPPPQLDSPVNEPDSQSKAESASEGTSSASGQVEVASGRQTPASQSQASTSEQTLLFSPLEAGMQLDRTGSLSNAIANALQETEQMFKEGHFPHVLALQASKLALEKDGTTVDVLFSRCATTGFEAFVSAVFSTKSVDDAIAAAAQAVGQVSSSSDDSSLDAEPLGLTLVGFVPHQVVVYGWRPDGAYQIVDLCLDKFGLGPGAGMRAGFRIGDIVTHVAGRPIENATDILDVTDPKLVGSQGATIRVLREPEELARAAAVHRHQEHYVEDLQMHVRRMVRTRVIVDWNAALGKFQRAAETLNRGVRGWLARTRLKLSASIASETVTKKVREEVAQLQHLLDTRVGSRVVRRLALMTELFPVVIAEAGAEAAKQEPSPPEPQPTFDTVVTRELLQFLSPLPAGDRATASRLQLRAVEGIGTYLTVDVVRSDASQPLGVFLDQTPRIAAFIAPLIEVTKLRENSLLAQAGCEAGDLIVGFDSEPFETINEFSTRIRGRLQFRLNIVRSGDPLYAQVKHPSLQHMRSRLETLLVDKIVSEFRDKARGIFTKAGLLQTARLMAHQNDDGAKKKEHGDLLVEAFDVANFAATKFNTIMKRVISKLFANLKSVQFPLNKEKLKRAELSAAEWGLLLYLSFIGAFLSPKCQKRVFESTLPPLQLLSRSDSSPKAEEPNSENDQTAPLRVLGFTFSTPAPIEYGMWRAAPIFVVSTVPKKSDVLPRSVAGLYGLNNNDVLIDLDQFSTSLTNKKHGSDWDLSTSFFHLEQQEIYLQDLANGLKTALPHAAPQQSESDRVDIGILHMGRQTVRLHQEDFLRAADHAALLYRCATARSTATYFTPEGEDAILRVQNQYRRRKYYTNFFPALQMLLKHRKAATVIQRVVRGRQLRLSQGMEQRLLVDRIVRHIVAQLEIRKTYWNDPNAPIQELTLSAYVLRAPPLTDDDVNAALSNILTTFPGPVHEDDYFMRVQDQGWLRESPNQAQTATAGGMAIDETQVPSMALYFVGEENSELEKGRHPSSATRLGLTGGDVLYLVGGKPVHGVTELNERLQAAEYARYTGTIVDESLELSKGKLKLSVFRRAALVDFPERVDRQAWISDLEVKIARGIAISQLQEMWTRSPSRALALTESAMSLWSLERRRTQLETSILQSRLDGTEAVDEDMMNMIDAGFNSASMNTYFETIGAIENSKIRAVDVILKRRFAGEPIGLEIETPKEFSIASVGWRARGYIKVTGLKARTDVLGNEEKATIGETSGLGPGDIIFMVDGSEDEVVNNFVKWAVSGSMDPCTLRVIHARQIETSTIADLATQTREVMRLEIKEKMLTSFAAFLMPAAQRSLVLVQAACRSFLSRKKVCRQYEGQNNPLLQKLQRTQDAARQTLWLPSATATLHAHWYSAQSNGASTTVSFEATSHALDALLLKDSFRLDELDPPQVTFNTLVSTFEIRCPTIFAL